MHINAWVYTFFYFFPICIYANITPLCPALEVAGQSLMRLPWAIFLCKFYGSLLKVSSSRCNFRLSVMNGAIYSHSTKLLPDSHACRFLLPILQQEIFWWPAIVDSFVGSFLTAIKKNPPVQQLIQDLWSVWNFTPRANMHIIRKQSLNTGKWRRALPLILLNGP